MNRNDLEIFNQMPFLFWVKDDQGRYLWGNRVISQLAGEDVSGKTDSELVWAENATSLREADREVFDSGKPSFLHEYVEESSQGNATLNVCKWIGDFEGKTCCYGISFVIE